MNDSAFIREIPPAPSPFVVLVDHASNIVPSWVNGGELGLPAKDMARHIAYDIGAENTARLLAQQLGAHLVCSRFSRLVIDPNRGEDDPTLIMQLYDGSIIPANRWIAGEAREERLEKLYRPYHKAVAEAIAAGGSEAVVISVHSFTPQLQGRAPRPWQIGLLSASDRRLTDPLLERLRHHTDYCIGDNEPYHGALKGDMMDQHCLSHGINHVLVEFRNDLIASPEGQQHWAALLATHLLAVIEEREDG